MNIETFQLMSGVKNLKGAKKEDLRALQVIWNAPESKAEFEDKRMLMGKNKNQFTQNLDIRRAVLVAIICKSKEFWKRSAFYIYRYTSDPDTTNL